MLLLRLLLCTVLLASCQCEQVVKLRANLAIQSRSTLFTEPLDLSVTIYSDDLFSTAPAGCTLHFRSEIYEHTVKTEQPIDFQGYSTRVQLAPRNPSLVRTFLTVPDVVRLKISCPHPLRVQCEGASCELSVPPSTYARELEQLVPLRAGHPRHRLNVLLFGFTGAGKTTFLNSVISALGHQVSTTFPEGKGIAHGTLEFFDAQLSHYVSHVDIGASIFDTWVSINGEFV